jgi:tetratricopeptide (TPR) repeat protein
MPADTQLTEARGLLAARRFEDAAAVCLAGLAEQPGEPDLLTILALAERAAGREESARDHLTVAVAADDQHLASRFHLARLLAGDGQYADAEALFTECLALDPNHAPARTLRARLASAGGDRERAIVELRTALRADPDHRPALTSLAELLVDEGQVDAADEMASRALAIDPEHPSVQMCMAGVLAAREHHDFAIQCLKNAVNRAAGDPRPRLALVKLLERMDRQDEAIAALDDAAANGHSGVEFTHVRARLEQRRGRNDEAAALYAALVSSVRADPDLILEAAKFALASGRLDDAAGLIRRSSVQGKSATGLLAARLAEAEGDRDRARSLASELVDNENERVADAARQLLARVALARGDFDEADRLLEPLSRRDDAAPEIVWLAARVREQLGDIDGAVALLRGLLDRSDPSDETGNASRARLAAILDRAGRYDAAAEQLPDSGWQPPFLGQSRTAGPIAAQVRQRLMPWRGEQEVPDDGRARPVFLSGWPGCGRELLLAALSTTHEARLLPVDDYAARRATIGLPAGIGQVAGLDDGSARLIRRKYLRRIEGVGERTRVVVETGLAEAPDWPLLARVIPGATVLCPSAPDEDLMLYWRFQGFRDRSRMLDAWHADVALQGELAGLLPLRVLFFDLAELLDAPELALDRLCDGLGLESGPAMVDAMRQQRIALGFRPIGHWRHYGD